MLSICDSFGIDYNVSFNASKFQFLHFTNNCNTKDSITGITHNIVFIKCTNSASHLGNIIGPDPSRLYDNVMNKFITCFNGINMKAFTKVSIICSKLFV